MASPLVSLSHEGTYWFPQNNAGKPLTWFTSDDTGFRFEEGTLDSNVTFKDKVKLASSVSHGCGMRNGQYFHKDWKPIGLGMKQFFLTVSEVGGARFEKWLIKADGPATLVQPSLVPAPDAGAMASPLVSLSHKETYWFPKNNSGKPLTWFTSDDTGFRFEEGTLDANVKEVDKVKLAWSGSHGCGTRDGQYFHKDGKPIGDGMKQFHLTVSEAGGARSETWLITQGFATLDERIVKDVTETRKEFEAEIAKLKAELLEASLAKSALAENLAEERALKARINTDATIANLRADIKAVFDERRPRFDKSVYLQLRQAALPPDEPDAPMKSAEALLRVYQERCHPSEVSGFDVLKRKLQRLVTEKLELQLRTGDPAIYGDLRVHHGSLNACAKDRFEGQLQSAALWSSVEVAIYRGAPRELCWLLNHALDLDDRELLKAGLPFIMSLNEFVVSNREAIPTLPKIQWPLPDKDGKMWLWRGGGFDEKCATIFEIGEKFRIPGFLATSSEEHVKNQFMMRATERGFPAIEWKLEIPAGCMHVMYLEKLYSLVDGEAEFLLAPYTVVEIVDIEWGTMGDHRKTNYTNPHKVTLRIAQDNMLELDNLRLSPWR